LIDKPAGALYVPPPVPTSLTVAVPALEQYGVPLYEIVAAGKSVIVMLVVAVTCGQPPAAASVYVTVYEPGVLVPKLTEPVAGVIDKPGVELYVPPPVPTRVTVAVPAFEQYGVPAYEIVAAGKSVIVMLVVAVTCPQPPVGAIVYVTV